MALLTTQNSFAPPRPSQGSFHLPTRGSFCGSYRNHGGRPGHGNWNNRGCWNNNGFHQNQWSSSPNNGYWSPIRVFPARN